jgi:hypothetical protein
MDAKERKAGQGQLDPEFECAKCQKLKIKYGAISSMVSFELETLSQHQLLIGQLQDEVFVQRSQIEDLHFCLEQCEKNQGQPFHPDQQWECVKEYFRSLSGPDS